MVRIIAASLAPELIERAMVYLPRGVGTMPISL